MICCELSVCKCVKIDKRSFSFKHTFLRSLSVLHRPVHLAAVGAFSSSVHLLIVCTFFYKKINVCIVVVVVIITAGFSGGLYVNVCYDVEMLDVVVYLGPTECMPDYNRVRGAMYWLRL